MSKRTKAQYSPAATHVQIKSLKVHDPRAGRDVEVYPMILRAAQTLWYGDIGTTEYKDAISQAVLAVLEKQQKFDKKRNVKLSTFLTWGIRGAFLDLKRKERLYQTRLEFCDPHKLPVVVQDRPSLELRLSDSLLFDKVIQVMEKKMPPHLAVLLVRFYLEGKNLALISKELGITQAVAETRLQEALAEVRRHFSVSPFATFR